MRPEGIAANEPWAYDQGQPTATGTGAHVKIHFSPGEPWDTGVEIGDGVGAGVRVESGAILAAIALIALIVISYFRANRLPLMLAMTGAVSIVGGGLGISGVEDGRRQTGETTTIAGSRRDLSR